MRSIELAKSSRTAHNRFKAATSWDDISSHRPQDGHEEPRDSRDDEKHLASSDPDAMSDLELGKDYGSEG